MTPVFFKNPPDWRRWLEANHATESEILVGFHKRHTARPSMTWSESVDEAICFGWIDGVRRSISDSTYSIRFTVRKPGSIWSKVNIAKARALVAAGRMAPAGLEKFTERKAARSGVYSFEQKDVEFDPGSQATFSANAKALDFFQRQAPSYRKRAIWWIISARLPATRKKRLAQLIAASARQVRL